MIRHTLGMCVLTSLLAVVACDKGSTDGEQAPQAQSEAAGAGVVEVAPDGTRFDPPVEIEQIPPGAWICDMGTVHYAALHAGEGTCPVCGMRLSQVPAGEPEPAPAEPPAGTGSGN